MKISSPIKILLALCLVGGALYGGGRLYFAVTDGFTVGNISSDWPYDARWETHALTVQEKASIDKALDQEYSYLGKGCQSYVFASEDGKYVVKFFKYQRFRTQPWLRPLTFFPPVEHYATSKARDKRARLDGIFWSWKAAFELFPAETGVVYVHLNKTSDLGKQLVIRDKLGLKHTLDLDQTEFLVQRRAAMLCPAIDELVAQGESFKAEQILDQLVAMIVSEYHRGYADNDHALMQNTGVIDGRPVHIDVGQFIRNDIVKDPTIYKAELHSKTFCFVAWLRQHHPDLAAHLIGRLESVIGPQLHTMPPYVYKGGVAKYPNQEL